MHWMPARAFSMLRKHANVDAHPYTDPAGYEYTY